LFLWLFGLSGSGKSSVANAFERTLHAEAELDGPLPEQRDSRALLLFCAELEVAFQAVQVMLARYPLECCRQAILQEIKDAGRNSDEFCEIYLLSDDF
jgi:hypothetical protein